MRQTFKVIARPSIPELRGSSILNSGLAAECSEKSKVIRHLKLVDHGGNIKNLCPFSTNSCFGSEWPNVCSIRDQVTSKEKELPGSVFPVEGAENFGQAAHLLQEITSLN